MSRKELNSSFFVILKKKEEGGLYLSWILSKECQKKNNNNKKTKKRKKWKVKFFIFRIWTQDQKKVTNIYWEENKNKNKIN